MSLSRASEGGSTWNGVTEGSLRFRVCSLAPSRVNCSVRKRDQEAAEQRRGRKGRGRAGGRGEGGFNVTNLRSPFGSVNPACRSRILQPPSLVSIARFLAETSGNFAIRHIGKGFRESVLGLPAAIANALARRNHSDGGRVVKMGRSESAPK